MALRHGQLPESGGTLAGDGAPIARLLTERCAPGEPAAAPPPATAPDALIARTLVVERDYGPAQRLRVGFERLRIAAGRLHADIVVTRDGRSRRAAGCLVAEAGRFVCGGLACRDDGGADYQHRALVRSLSGVPLLDRYLDALLGGVEARLLALISTREDWLGPASRPVRLDPISFAVPDLPGVCVAAEDLRYDGALHGELRLRVGCRLASRTRAGALVGPDGRFDPALGAALRRGAPLRLSALRGGALRAAVRDLGERLAALHRVLSGPDPTD